MYHISHSHFHSLSLHNLPLTCARTNIDSTHLIELVLALSTPTKALVCHKFVIDKHRIEPLSSRRRRIWINKKVVHSLAPEMGLLCVFI